MVPKKVQGMSEKSHVVSSEVKPENLREQVQARLPRSSRLNRYSALSIVESGVP